MNADAPVRIVFTENDDAQARRRIVVRLAQLLDKPRDEGGPAPDRVSCSVSGPQTS